MKIKNYLITALIIGFTASFAQVQLDATGSGNAFSVTYPAVIVSAPSGGIEFTFKANHAVTGAATLNLNGLGAKPILKNFDKPLDAGDIKAGHFVRVIYDNSSGGSWQMISSSANASGGGVAGSGTTNGVAFFSNNTTITADGANFKYNSGTYTELTLGKINVKSKSTNGDNLAIGANAGNATMAGSFNTMYGANTGAALTTGGDNAFFGTGAGSVNTIGLNNSFFGSGAGAGNTTGQFNTFFGSDAGLTNITGTNLVVIGKGANVASTNLTNAIAIGANTNIAGSNSVVIGNNITGLGINTSSPTRMLDVNGGARIRNLSFTGSVITVDGSGNLGMATLNAGINPWTVSGTNVQTISNAHNVDILSSTGYYAIGNQRVISRQGGSIYLGAGTALTGDNNLFYGASAGQSNTTGSNNIFLGPNAGKNNTTGNNNIAIGSGSNVSGTINNAIALGQNANVNTSNTLVIAPSIVFVGIGTNTPAIKLDVRGTTSNGTDASPENLFQVGSNTVTNPISLRVGVKTGLLAINQYTFIEASDIVPKPIAIQPNGGNIGIGTTTPANKLDVNGNVAIGAYAGVNAAPANSLIVSGSIGIGTTFPGLKLDVRCTTATATTAPRENILMVSATDISTPLRMVMGVKTDATPANRYTFIEALDTGPQSLVLQPVNGNVGIGSTTASVKLDVNGALAIRSVTTVLGAGGTINPTLPTSSYSYFRISAAGAITLSATNAIANGSVIGQILVIENAGTFTITINDNARTQLNGNVAYAIGTGDTLMVIWNGTDWMEISRSNN